MFSLRIWHILLNVEISIVIRITSTFLIECIIFNYYNLKHSTTTTICLKSKVECGSMDLLEMSAMNASEWWFN